jgi:hypothetical protein
MLIGEVDSLTVANHFQRDYRFEGELIMEQSIAVMLMTHTHRITGRVNHADQRLQDVVNNKLSQVLNILDARLYRPANAQTMVAHLPAITVPKVHVNLILLDEQHHEAPTKRLFSFVQKQTFDAFLAVPGYEVEGCFHFTSPQRPEYFLIDTITTFVPITAATITSVDNPALTWETPVLFAQRSAINLLHLGE